MTNPGTSTKILSLAILADLLAVFLPLAFSSLLLPEPVAASSVSPSPNSQLSSPATTSGSSAASVGTLGETCNNSDALEAQLTSFVNGWVQATKWFGKPETGIDMLIQNFGSQLINNLNSTPWPDINQRARLARVPVIMYHDILPKKQVFFDVTPEELEQHLRLIQSNGVTPISLDQLVTHLRTGLPLPSKPILLTFDDGYGGHYDYAYPLLKKYGYPAVFSIYTSNVGKNTGRTHVTWQQLQQMVADPLVTIASHSVTHPLDLRPLSNNQLMIEVMVSKRILEAQLGIPIRYFAYPSGKYDARVANLIREAGYQAALTMNNLDDRNAGQSKSLLAIDRIGQSKLAQAIAQAWGGPKLSRWNHGFDFTQIKQESPKASSREVNCQPHPTY